MARKSAASWNIGARWRADRHYSKGCRLVRAGKPTEALKAFDQVIAILPKHARAHLQRALALAAAGRIAEAVHAARQAAELAPRNHAPLLFLGQIQYDAGHHEEARKAFSAAARLDPQNRVVQAYLGLALLALGHKDEGAGLLRAHLRYGYEGLEGRLLTLAEQHLYQHRDQARSLEDQLTPEESGREEAPAGCGLRLASAVRMALLWPFAMVRGRAALSWLRAEEAMSIRDWGAAISSLRQAEQAGAHPEKVAAALGQAYLEAGKPEVAAEHFARLPEETRQEPEMAALAGFAFFESGRYEQASKPLEITAARFSREYLPCYYRGLCEIALGQPKAATAWFIQAAARLNPHIAEKRLEEMLRVQAEQ